MSLEIKHLRVRAINDFKHPSKARIVENDPEKILGFRKWLSGIISRKTKSAKEDEGIGSQMSIWVYPTSHGMHTRPEVGQWVETNPTPEILRRVGNIPRTEIKDPQPKLFLIGGLFNQIKSLRKSIYLIF